MAPVLQGLNALKENVLKDFGFKDDNCAKIRGIIFIQDKSLDPSALKEQTC